MESRKLIESDYEQLMEWWAQWGWKFPPLQEFLPDNGTCGFIISDGNINICAGFLYKMSNAPIGWFTFPISNPYIRGEERKSAMDLLITEIEREAKESGIKYLYSCLRNQSMIERQKEHGYVESGKNYTELLKII